MSTAFSPMEDLTVTVPIEIDGVRLHTLPIPTGRGRHRHRRGVPRAVWLTAALTLIFAVGLVGAQGALSMADVSLAHLAVLAADVLFGVLT